MTARGVRLAGLLTLLVMGVSWRHCASGRRGAPMRRGKAGLPKHRCCTAYIAWAGLRAAATRLKAA